MISETNNKNTRSAILLFKGDFISARKIKAEFAKSNQLNLKTHSCTSQIIQD